MSATSQPNEALNPDGPAETGTAGPIDERKPNKALKRIAAVSTLGGLLFGYDTGGKKRQAVKGSLGSMDWVSQVFRIQPWCGSSLISHSRTLPGPAITLR